MKRIILSCLFFLPVICFSQDGTFSTGFNAVGWTNLALQGEDSSAQISSVQRIQWPGLSANYFSSFSSFTQYLPKINSWISINYYSENAAQLLFTKRFGIAFNKGIFIGKHFLWKNALEMVYYKYEVDWSSLTFGMAIDPQNGFTLQAGDVPRGGSLGNIDFSYGTSFHFKEITLGVGIFHLNEPNSSLTSGTNSLPMRVTYSGGYNLSLKKYALQVQPYFVYRNQRAFDVFLSGMRIKYNEKINLGLCLQLNYQKMQVYTIGYTSKYLAINYSFSNYPNLTGDGGAHQLGSSIKFWKRKKTGKNYFNPSQGAFSTH